MTQPINSLNSNVDFVQQDVPLLQMPSEVAIQILTRLPIQDIGTSAQVCRQWNQIQNDYFWRLLFENHFSNIDSNAIKNFKNAYQTRSNLIKGVYASRTLSGHNDTVCSLTIADGKLISGSEDGIIKIWDIKTGECTATLKGHKGWVRCLVATGEKLFSGSPDSTIKVWNLKTGECIKTLHEHGSRVSSLAVADGMLFSGLSNHTINVRDLQTLECTMTLKGHNDGVTSLFSADGQLFSGSDDTIKIWDLKTGECTNTLKADEKDTISLTVADGQLFSSADDTIKIWDIKTGECANTLQVDGSWVRFLIIADGKLFSGSDDTIKVWDLKTGDCITTIKGHGNWLRVFALSEEKIFSSSEECTIKVWDFTASHSAIFQEIAQLLERATPQSTSQALERFSKMPKTAKDAIYGKLYEICKPFANDYSGCAEHAFYDQHGQNSTPAQKAQAIRDYLDF